MALHPRIQKRLKTLDKKTEALFNYVATVPDELLSVRPEPNAWSVLEALNHIYLGERLSLDYVKYKLTKPETIPDRKPDAWLRTIMLKWILRSSLKFKSPAPINMRSDQQVLQPEELKKVWTAMRQELTGLLDRHEEGLRKKLAYKQPKAGRMTLRQMLIFFEDHLLHHDKQIHQIVSRVSA